MAIEYDQKHNKTSQQGGRGLSGCWWEGLELLISFGIEFVEPFFETLFLL